MFRAMRTGAWLIALALLALPSAAHAFEHQHHIGIDPYASLFTARLNNPGIGAGVGVHYTYGLTDQFNLMIEAGTGIAKFGSTTPPAPDPNDPNPPVPAAFPRAATFGGAGVGYVLDILRYVPYFGVLGAGYDLAGGSLPKATFVFGLQLAIGLDYQIDRHWALGAAYRQHILITQADDYPSFSTLGLRAEYIWGW